MKVPIRLILSLLIVILKLRDIKISVNMECPGTEANHNQVHADYGEKQIMRIILEPEGKPEYKSTYEFLYIPEERKSNQNTPLLNF